MIAMAPFSSYSGKLKEQVPLGEINFLTIVPWQQGQSNGSGFSLAIMGKTELVTRRRRLRISE